MELIGLFDSQKSRIEQLGPTEDYVRLELLLAQAEMPHNVAAASSRLVDVYLFIDKIVDLVPKAACLAFLVSALCEMDPARINLLQAS